MNEFDGVFDRDDMIAAILVGIIDHGGEGGGFAGARGSGHHDQTAVKHAELLEHAGQGRVELLKVLEGEDLRRNLAEDGTDAIFLVIEIGAEAGNERDLVAEIDVARFLKDLNLVLRCDLVEHLLKIIILEWGMVHAMKLAVHSEHGVIARGKVQVRGLLLEHQIEESIDLRHKNLYSLSDG